MRLVFILSLFFVLFSCTDGVKETINYKISKGMPTLVIPPDLTQLSDENNKTLPSSNLGTLKAQGRYKEIGEFVDDVLPRFKGMELQGEGGFYWLKLQQKPSEVYAALKQFWATEGFTLEKDEPLIGLMQTDWLENNAAITALSNNFLTRLLGNSSSATEKDQYTSRIEADSDGGTKVFLTQKGIKYIVANDASGQQQGWQNRPNEPALEAEMLSRMMVFLGMQDADVQEQLAKIGQFPSRARLDKNKDGQIKLLVMNDFDQTWNRTLMSLDRLGVEIVERNKAGGIIKIRQKPINMTQKDQGFFASLFSADKEQQQVELVEMSIGLVEVTAESTQISIVSENGDKKQSDRTVVMLQYLFKSLK